MKCISKRNERGAALPMVLLVTFLLVTATAALLHTAAANSRNTTNTLSEAKAYYTAESGIQAAVNALRNQNINYKDAVNNDGGTLQDWIPYDCGGTHVPVGGSCDNKFTVTVSDPDNSQTQITFSSDTLTTNPLVPNASGFSLSGASYAPELWVPNSTDANRTKISWVPTNPVSPLQFNGSPNVIHSLGMFRLDNFGTGATTIPKVYFRINLRVPGAETGTWIVTGSIEAGTPNTFRFQADTYRMYGSDLDLCAASNCAVVGQPDINNKPLALPAPADGAFAETQFWLRLSPKEPQRLVIRSTGIIDAFGSKKTLEGIIQKTAFPAVPPAAGLLMNGPNASFSNGSGMPHYNGCDPLNPDVCVPAIGTTTPAGLTDIIGGPNEFKDPPNPDPPPAIVGENLPEWQKYPSEMEKFINFWKLQAGINQTIYSPGADLMTGDYGNYDAADGVAYCEGDCSISGTGGGILIVRGKLTTKGGVNFRGLIIVTGTEGMLRNGNGGPDDVIIGSVVVAPYTLTPAPYGTWLQPKFSVNGGGQSGITYSGLDFLFDGGISGATNFVSGVAEK